MARGVPSLVIVSSIALALSGAVAVRSSAQTVGGEILYTSGPYADPPAFLPILSTVAMQLRFDEPATITAVIIFPRVTQPCDFRLHFWDSELSASSPGQTSSLLSITVANDDQEHEATAHWSAAPNTNLYIGVSASSQTGCTGGSFQLRTSANGVLYQNDGTGRWTPADIDSTDPVFIQVEGIRDRGTTDPPTGGLPIEPCSPNFVLAIGGVFFVVGAVAGGVATKRILAALVLGVILLLLWLLLIGPWACGGAR